MNPTTNSTLILPPAAGPMPQMDQSVELRYLAADLQSPCSADEIAARVETIRHSLQEICHALDEFDRTEPPKWSTDRRVTLGKEL